MTWYVYLELIDETCVGGAEMGEGMDHQLMNEWLECLVYCYCIRMIALIFAVRVGVKVRVMVSC